jgi:hypothetical protein
LGAVTGSTPPASQAVTLAGSAGPGSRTRYSNTPARVAAREAPLPAPTAPPNRPVITSSCPASSTLTSSPLSPGKSISAIYASPVSVSSGECSRYQPAGPAAARKPRPAPASPAATASRARGTAPAAPVVREPGRVTEPPRRSGSKAITFTPSRVSRLRSADTTPAGLSRSHPPPGLAAGPRHESRPGDAGPGPQDDDARAITVPAPRACGDRAPLPRAGPCCRRIDPCCITETALTSRSQDDQSGIDATATTIQHRQPVVFLNGCSALPERPQRTDMAEAWGAFGRPRPPAWPAGRRVPAAPSAY